MKRVTSRGTASVNELCEAFMLSRQAYCAAKQRMEEKSSDVAEPATVDSGGGRRSSILGHPSPAVSHDAAARGDPRGDPALASVGRAQGAGVPAARVIVSRRRVWRVMKAHALVLPASAPERREAAPRRLLRSRSRTDAGRPT
jgi:hypothetical protein